MFLMGLLPGGRSALAIAAIAVAAIPLATPTSAQTRTTRDTMTAYGARLNAKGEPANLNPNRINSRINSRLETRLSLRIERYRPDSAIDPTAAYTVRPTDNARVGTETTLSPLATSALSSSAQSYTGSSQTSPKQNNDGPSPR